MSNDDSSKTRVTGVTSIDLGDDLMSEKTGPQPGEQTSPRGDGAATRHAAHSSFEPPENAAEAEDRVESARILMSEGMFEEAKRLLHRVLIFDSNHIVGIQLLEKIHETELKQIFSEQNTKQRFGNKSQYADIDFDSDEVMRALDRDLKLGFFSHEGEERPTLQLSLFQDQEEMEQFSRKLEEDSAGSTVQDRIDLGVAFLEMTLYDLAVRQFRSAHRTTSIEMQRFATGVSRTPLEKSEEFVSRLSSHLSCTSLLAFAQILNGQPFEATLTLQPVIQDSEISELNKVEFIYLLGRAYERMAKGDLSLSCYLKVLEIDPHYRDAEERVRSHQ